ncbi:Metallo-dependent phosphatase-like protein, partial [Vararia minispora EC-137]
RPILFLQVAWVLFVLRNELEVFYRSASCVWPDRALDSLFVRPYCPSAQNSDPAHVLIVADPQMLDEDSYPGRGPWLMMVTQFIVDMFLRKAWHVAMAKQPDAVVFLGDMLDNGRAKREHKAYLAYVQKFKKMFPASRGLPVFYLPGNHDVWLGGSDELSKLARARYQTYFGPLNHQALIGNHTLAFIDAPGLVEEYKTHTQASTVPTVEHWVPQSIRELRKVVDMSIPDGARPWPLVLFSHIPLARPDGTDCGPLREKGTLRAGRGLGYENTLSDATSKMLLDTFRPSVIFSGDDHDYCDVTHSVAASDDRTSPQTTVHEISVKSLSMAMGIRRPGFELLSLATPRTPWSPSFAHAPCVLPDQIGVYVWSYAPLAAATLSALF